MTPIKRIHFSIFLGAVLGILYPFHAQAKSAEQVRVIQVLSADAMVVATYTRSNEDSDNSRYVFLAGCNAPLTGQPGANEAKVALANLIEGKIVTLITLAKHGNRTLGSVFFNQTQDVCGSLLRQGLSFYNSDESSLLGSVQVGGYRTLQSKARSSRVGLWHGINDTHYVPSARAWDSLNLDVYQQTYVNGVPNPSLRGFNRPNTAPLPLTQRKDPTDWRQPRHLSNENLPNNQGGRTE